MEGLASHRTQICSYDTLAWQHRRGDALGEEFSPCFYGTDGGTGAPYDSYACINSKSILQRHQPPDAQVLAQPGQRAFKNIGRIRHRSSAGRSGCAHCSREHIYSAVASKAPGFLLLIRPGCLRAALFAVPGPARCKQDDGNDFAVRCYSATMPQQSKSANARSRAEKTNMKKESSSRNLDRHLTRTRSAAGQLE